MTNKNNVKNAAIRAYAAGYGTIRADDFEGNVTMNKPGILEVWGQDQVTGKGLYLTIKNGQIIKNA